MSETVVKKEFDVLVLGTGVAGWVAAATIAKKGLSVAIIGCFGGASAQSSGAVDSGEEPEHQTIALKMLCEAAPAVDLHSSSQNMLLGTELGTTKRVVLAQRTQCFDLGSLKNGDTVTVVGLAGLTSFHPDRAAKLLSWSIKQQLAREVNVKSVTLEVGKKGLWRSSLELSRALDDDAHMQNLMRALKGFHGERAMLIPAILSRQHYRKQWELLQKECGPTFELLALPTSVPGLRLADALNANKALISHIEGEGMTAHFEKKRIRAVEVETHAGATLYRAKSFILATGRFFSHGFERQGVRREKIFDLPLWHDGRLIEDLPSRQLTSPGMRSEQPLLRAGLRVDARSRPFDRMMELFAPNLFAAGSAIEGPLSLGRAALSGYLSAFHTLALLERE